MNEVHDGPQCSLISYVVPPGLSRVPVVGPSDPIPYTITPLETVSAKSGVTEENARNDNPRLKEEAVNPTTSSTFGTISETPGVRRNPSVRSSLAQRPISSAPRPAKKSGHTFTVGSHSQPPRKSCLTQSVPAVLPARLNLKKKTVAFGKTVNVSQTIEGTSRFAKLRNIMDKNESLRREPVCDSENKENESQNSGKETEERTALLDILKDVKSSLDALKIRDEERAEELRSIRQAVIERGKEVDLLRGMFADYIGKDCPRSFDSVGENVSPKRSVRGETEPSPERIGRKPQIRSSQRSNQPYYSSPTRELGSQFDSDPNDDDEITFEEFRRLLTTNPTLRQFVADIRAEESEQLAGRADRRPRNGRGVVCRWKDSPRAAERCKESKVERGRRDDLSQRGRRGAKYTEKVTVERSVRCLPQDLANYSVDTRRYLENQILDDNVETVESVYRPGESVSYYPERTRRHGYAGDSPDSNDDSVYEGRAYRDYAAVEERRRRRRSHHTDRF